MISITEIKRRLPEKFIEELYENFSPLVVDSILVGMNQERFTTLRVNTLKFNIQDLMKSIVDKFYNWYRPSFNKQLI